MKSEYRSLKMTIAAGVTTRTETFNGREHLVVPVVALVEGVIHAMNARNAELVTLAEYGKAPGGWNGRPLFSGHPMVDGAPVSGNSPEILETLSLGLVFNAAITKDKLTMEAWIDVLKADEVDPSLLKRINAGKPVEISVGLFVRTDDEEGTYQGKKYLGKWAEIVPDHLALLAESDEGACSRKMGCGVRAAKGDAVKKIDKTGAGLFARIMATFRLAQPAVEQSDNDIRRKLYEELKEVEPACNYVEAVYSDLGLVVYSVYSAGMGPYTLSLYRRTFVQATDGTITLGNDREEVEPVLTYEPVDAEETDEVVAAAATKKVQAMHDHAVALGAMCAPYAAGAAPKAAGSCGCGGHPAAASTGTTNKEETVDMNKEARIKALIGEGKGTFTEADRAMLEAADETTLGRFEAAQAAQVTALKTASDATAAVTTELTTLKTAAAAAPAPKSATFDELLATADPGTRELISSGRAMGQARKDASIKLLKDSGRCKITDVKLTAMSQCELDELVALANIPVVAVSTVDFSGNGAPRAGSTNTEVPAAPDLFAALRADKK